LNQAITVSEMTSTQLFVQEPTPRVSSNEAIDGPTLVATPKGIILEAPDPVALSAYIKVNDAKLKSPRITGTVRNQNGDVLVVLEYLDNGTGPDALPGDSVYSAIYYPQIDISNPGQQYSVTIVASTLTGGELSLTTTFYYGFPKARFQGPCLDTEISGQLQLSCLVDVREQHLFHIEGQLVAEDGRFVAATQTNEELSVGNHWVSLTFSGTDIHESAINGPYLLNKVFISVAGAIPASIHRLRDSGYRTNAFTISNFGVDGRP
jgi:hypothetical protein